METERLFFRRWTEGDAAELFRWASDPDVGPSAGWPPHESAEESLRVIREVFSAPECWAICLKPGGAAIGTIELMLAGHARLAGGEDECELGYWLAKPFWGRGYMPEAVREMLRHAFEDLGMSCVWVGRYDGNEKSRRVQEKCGFRYQWSEAGVDVPLLHEVRVDHISCLTRGEWFGDRVRPVTENKKAFLPLLLLADEQEDMVDRYLERGEMYVFGDGGVPRAECVVTDEGGGVLEIKNIAVAPAYQGKGYGRALIEWVAKRYRGEYETLQAGTGDSPLTLPFYEACGFVRHHVIPGFFTDNYDHPIFEGGKQLVDMVVLRRPLR